MDKDLVMFHLPDQVYRRALGCFTVLTLGQNTQHWCFSALKSLDRDDDEMKLSLTVGKE